MAEARILRNYNRFELVKSYSLDITLCIRLKATIFLQQINFKFIFFLESHVIGCVIVTQNISPFFFKDISDDRLFWNPTDYIRQ